MLSQIVCDVKMLEEYSAVRQILLAEYDEGSKARQKRMNLSVICNGSRRGERGVRVCIAMRGVRRCNY